MGICLGNLTITELEKRTGWTFSAEDRKWLEDHRQEKADICPYKEEFHIFDIPFLIEASSLIKSRITNMLMEYNNKQPSKEPLQLGFRLESEEERIAREKKEAEEKERLERIENPKSIWNVKWHMLVPVKVTYFGKEYNLYYSCFINTYTTGRNNIPDIIDGTAIVSCNEEGCHGRFTLYNPETDNDANEHPDWDWVISNGLCHLSGNYIDCSYENVTFEEVRFSIKEAIELYKNVKNYDGKEIHFSGIAK